MKKSENLNFKSIPTANFIGCGKLGKTMAYLLVKNGLIKIIDIYNKRDKSNENSIEFVGVGRSCTDLTKLKSANIYFIATPDDSIEIVCNQIIEKSKIEPGSIFVHFSGSLTTVVLKSASSLGHHVCSLHPIRSFANPEESAKSFKGTFCAFEGSELAYEILSGMINKIGGEVFHIQKDKKSLYHAAGVFACNYVTTLAYCAMQCYKSCGILEENAKKIIVSLMQGTINNMSIIESFPDSLTGPLQRGDLKTIQKHLEALNSEYNLEECYRILGKKTLEITKHKDKVKSTLREIL